MFFKLNAALWLTGLIIPFAVSAQSLNPFQQAGDVFGTRVFIENKGQFNGEIGRAHV